MEMKLDIARCKTCTHFVERNMSVPICLIPVKKGYVQHGLKDGRDVAAFCKYKKKGDA